MRFPVVLVLLLAACMPAFDRGHVGGELRRRVGFGLQPERAPGPPVLPPGCDLGDGLDEAEAVAIALFNNPSFEADLLQVGVARGDMLDAAVPANPLLQLLFPGGAGGGIAATLYWAFDTLWQLPSRLKAARREQARTVETLVQRGLDLVRDVRLAHADAIWAAERLGLRQEAAALWVATAQLARRQAVAGDLGETDAAGVEGEAESAGELVIRGAREVIVADERLWLLLGLTLSEHRPRVLARPVDIGARRSLAELLPLTLAERPDLKAARLAIEASAARLGWERSRVLGLTLMVEAGAGTGTRPGVRVVPPLFDLNLGGMTRAGARVLQAAWQLEAARQRAAFELREAHARVLQAQTSLTIFRTKILPPIEANLRGARRAQEVGAQPPLFVLDSLRRHVDARLRGLELEAELRRGIAELDRAIGGGKP